MSSPDLAEASVPQNWPVLGRRLACSGAAVVGSACSSGASPLRVTVMAVTSVEEG